METTQTITLNGIESRIYSRRLLEQRIWLDYYLMRNTLTLLVSEHFQTLGSATGCQRLQQVSHFHFNFLIKKKQNHNKKEKKEERERGEWGECELWTKTNFRVFFCLCLDYDFNLGETTNLTVSKSMCVVAHMSLWLCKWLSRIFFVSSSTENGCCVRAWNTHLSI